MQKNNPKDKVEKLEQENKQLRARLRLLINGTAKKPPSHTSKTGLVVFLAGLAGALLVVGNILLWTSLTLTNTGRFTEISKPLIREPAVQNAIVKETTKAIFNQVNVEQIASDALPDRAQFLAPSIAGQVESFVSGQTKQIVASDKFQSTWDSVVQNAHQKFISGVRNYDGGGTISVNGLYNRLSTQLSDGKLSFLSNKPIPPRVGEITIISAPNFPKAHWLVVNLWWLRLLIIAVFLLLSASVIWLAQKKRRAVLRLSMLYGILAVASMLAMRITREILISKVQPDYKALSQSIWTTVLHPLSVQTVALAVVFFVITLIAWLSGDSAWARSIQKTIKTILGGKLHRAFFAKENGVTKWFGQNKSIFMWLLIAGAVIALLIIRLTISNVLIVALVLTVLVLVLETIALRE